jgi:hypothetical protein
MVTAAAALAAVLAVLGLHVTTVGAACLGPTNATSTLWGFGTGTGTVTSFSAVSSSSTAGRSMTYLGTYIIQGIPSKVVAVAGASSSSNNYAAVGILQLNATSLAFIKSLLISSNSGSSLGFSSRGRNGFGGAWSCGLACIAHRAGLVPSLGSQVCVVVLVLPCSGGDAA